MRRYLVSFTVFVLLGSISCDEEESSGDDMGSDMCPQCQLMRDECIPVGECTFEGAAYGAAGSRDCWDNGVVQVHDSATMTTVTRNGEPCHSWESNGLTSTFFTPDGEVAATMTFDFQANSVVIDCDGQTYRVTPEQMCPSWFPQGVNCQQGTCPAP